ncbi:protein timeless homolog isoform X2 [Aphis gossypii]|uniref:protein timeless homolog isoform X2 n=1 Tax=Aphis gossypii TaxID=80765 RepID=UPI0021593EB2|nr:protein timeless homolog isoform X2 [Aphis gossypii]
MALVHAELTATCNSLGYAGPEKYCIDPQCSEAVRDLIKFLRRDGDDHEIRRHLGTANIVETDLLPILVEYSNNLDLFDLIIRLLVNLTTPTLLIYNEQPPTEKTQSQYYLQMVSHLQKYKRAFTDVNVWNVIVNKLAKVIQAEYHEKGEEKVLSTVRLLILVRNILHVPADNDAECRPDNDANLHDQVLWAMHQSQLIDIIMYIACSVNEKQYYLHALEIISLMLRDQKASELANASINRTETEKQRDEHELKIVLDKERKEKMDKLKKYSGSRHSKFGGRFVVSGMKSIGENEMVVSSMTSNISKAFDRYKKPLKTPRNRLPLRDVDVERKSAFSVRLFLKEFCVEFLYGAYNMLMKHVREILVRSKGQPNDESYYFWAIQFFMEFNRNYKFEIKLVSETMALNIFHFVQERIEESREKLITDKKKIPIWSKRMHLGLKAYKELMETLLVMYQSKNPTLESSARTILTNLFYMVEYRDLLLGLLNLYDEVKFSRMYLKDVIETNHIFMKLLEHLGKKQRNLIVQCKSRKKTYKKSKTATQVTPENDDSMWNNFSTNLKEIIQIHEQVNVIEARPYDPISEVPMEDQKVETMQRIQMHLRNKRLEESVQLLRASREVWPEDSYFGKPGLNSDDELDILKQIFFADLGTLTGYDENITESINLNDTENINVDEEEDSSQIRTEETNFEFLDFVKKFAKPKILQSCCQLLKEFDTNSTYTNHAIVKLLHRITYGCKYSALMFQASVFRVFQKIFSSKNPNHKELKHFAIFIMRKFTEVAKKNKKVFVELLFWKDLKVAYEIEEGYDADQKTKTTSWNEEQEDELHRLHQEYAQVMPDEDEVAWICKNLIRQDRSKISIIKKLKQLDIIPIRKTKRMVREFSSNDDLDLDYDTEPTYHSLTSVYVLNSIKKIINKDMKTALLWLIESLDEAVDDLDVDESDIPLLPLSDECMTAVNDVDFQDMMQILGLHRPSSIQETYWRIPGRWQANDIHQRSTSIKNVIEGNFVTDETNTTYKVDDSSDEDVGTTFDRIRKSLAQNSVNDDQEIINTKLNNPHYSKEKIGFNKSIGHNINTFLLENSDVEDNVTPIKVLLDTSGNNISGHSFSIKQLLEDSDEDDLEKSIVSMKKRKAVLEDSDEEDEEAIPNQKISNHIILEQVDSDKGNNQNASTLKKMNTLLEDDTVHTMKSHLDGSDKEGFDETHKRKSSLTNSDSEEEIGGFIKKTKYFINDDSD